MDMPVFKQIAMYFEGYDSCLSIKKNAQAQKLQAKIRELVKKHMPQQGGFDSNTFLDFKDTTGGTKLVFNTTFRHMDENEKIDEETFHVVTICANLCCGFTLDISGPDHNGIKDYMGDTFRTALNQIIPFD